MTMTHVMGKGHTIVTLLCDTSDKYKENIFDENFLFKKEIPAPTGLNKCIIKNL